MKKILFAISMILPMLFIGCEQAPIVFEHEKPQFDLKENAILLEVIVPAGTSAKDEIDIVGAFNGNDTIHDVNPDYLLQKAKKGFDAQYNEHKEKLNLLSEIIGDYEKGVNKNG